MGSRRALTERDRFWLDHEKAIAKSGQSAKDYAAEQGLSLHALYQARKRLKAEGHLPQDGKIATASKRRRSKSGGGHRLLEDRAGLVSIARSRLSPLAARPVSSSSGAAARSPSPSSISWSGSPSPDDAP